VIPSNGAGFALRYNIDYFWIPAFAGMIVFLNRYSYPHFVSPLRDAAHRFGRNDPAPNYHALIRREFALNLCGTWRQEPIWCGAGFTTTKVVLTFG